MQRHRSLHRNRDLSVIGWISTADAFLFASVLFLVAALFLESRLAQQRQARSDDAESARLAAESAGLAMREQANRIADLESKLGLLQAETGALKTNNAAAENKLLQTQNEKSLLATQLNAAKEQAAELRMKHDSLVSEMKKADTNYRELERQFAALKKSAVDLEAQVKDGKANYSVMQAQYQATQAELDSFKRLRDSEGRLRRELIGLKGQMRRVAILIDCSGSMTEKNRWESAQAVLKTWLEKLDMEQCRVVIFSTDIKTFPQTAAFASVRDGGEKVRKEIMDFLGRSNPEGGTNTLKALEDAYAQADLDTIILFTDGAPNDGNSPRFDPKVAEKIYRLCEKHNTIPINAVGLGDYFKDDLSSFLLKVAEITGGTFFGR